ncbi:hypothetical protein MTO96_047079 [Rhipicephalus appendiculatus]
MTTVEMLLDEIQDPILSVGVATVRRVAGGIPGCITATTHWRLAFRFPDAQNVLCVEAIHAADGNLQMTTSLVSNARYNTTPATKVSGVPPVTK